MKVTVSTRLGPAWLALGPVDGFFASLALASMVAAADYLSGYELRLALFYIFPIWLATWTGGMRSGIILSITATCFWIISFQASGQYSQSLFYYWEGLELVVTFCIFVILMVRLRAALARADARFTHVLEGLHSGVYVIEHDNDTVVYANRRLKEMIGEDPEQRDAAGLELLFGPHANAPANAGHRPDARFSSREVRDAHTQRCYLVQEGAIPWEGKRPATLKLVTDISDQKQAELVKRRHQETLNNTAHFAALAEIASRLGHELNQPLMAIAGYLDAGLLLLSKEQVDQQEVMLALQKCRVQTVRASRVVEGTRDILRKRLPAQSGTDLNKTLRDAVQALELTFQEADISVEMQLDEELPETIFDRTLIEQVVINLLNNAADAVMSVPPDRRRITLASRINDEGAVMVTVSDNGIGIRDDVTQQIYTPFYTTKAHGIGLGLSICRSVVEAHAGQLWHNPAPGGGTEFHFTLSVTSSAVA